MDISVIVPVYNVKSYLSACLDSILNQDFDSYEIVVVDDGSTDGSGELAEQYASRHTDKIRVLHQENQGLGGARNTGIKAVSYTHLKEGKQFLNYKFKNMVFIVNNSLKWDLKIIIIKLLVEI